MTAISAAIYSQTEQTTTRTISNGHCNGSAIGNGVITTTSTTTTTATVSGKTQEQSILVTFILTIYDVIIFLGISLGYIFQDWYYRLFGRPLKEMRGELALITGGGGGLGRLLALRLANLGVDTVIWDINQEGIDETVAQVKAVGGKCSGYKVDISKKEEVYKAAEAIRENEGDVTLLINNAGVVSGRALLDTPDHLIERSFNVNVMAHFWTTKAFLPAMLEKDHGHIVSIASMAGHVGISKLVDYCASKFAAVGFDEALRLELESLGSKVETTCVCPFFIQSTGMFDDVNSRWVPTLTSEDVADRVVSAIQRQEKVAILPRYLQFMLCIKWIFPWGCAANFLQRIVPDAAPQHGLLNGMPHLQKQLSEQSLKLAGSSTQDEATQAGDSDGTNNNNSMNNNNNKAASMLIKRLPSIGERVL